MLRDDAPHTAALDATVGRHSDIAAIRMRQGATNCPKKRLIVIKCQSPTYTLSYKRPSFAASRYSRDDAPPLRYADNNFAVASFPDSAAGGSLTAQASTRHFDRKMGLHASNYRPNSANPPLRAQPQAAKISGTFRAWRGRGGCRPLLLTHCDNRRPEFYYGW